MRIISPTKRFDRDLRKVWERKKDLSKLKDAVRMLAKDGKVPPKYKLHPLIGNWIPCWDCHIESDWLLIYQTTKTYVYLFRTGTYSDLF